MTVKELKILLELPEGVSQQDFDNLEVLVLNNKDVIEPAKFEESGYVVFGGNCDEEGNLIGTDFNDEKYNVPSFLIAIGDE
jgi:hypothetical protein